MSSGVNELRTKVSKFRPRKINYQLRSILVEKFEYENTGFVFGTKVKYLSFAERKEYEIFVNKKGLIVNHLGEIIDTSKSRTIKSGSGVGIFVMSPKGRIYLSQRHAVGKFHHSSFLKGGPVATAGEISIINGKIKMINNRSGHYYPSEKSLDQLMIELKDRSFDTKDINIKFYTNELYD